jgi:hypothetical protein
MARTDRSTLRILNSSHIHLIVRCYLAGWVWAVPAGNEKLPVAHTRRGLLSWGQPMRESKERKMRAPKVKSKAG